VLASLLGAGAGGSRASVIPADALQLAASAGFLVIGGRLLVMAGRGDNDEVAEASDKDSGETAV